MSIAITYKYTTGDKIVGTGSIHYLRVEWPLTSETFENLRNNIKESYNYKECIIVNIIPLKDSKEDEDLRTDKYERSNNVTI